MLTIRSMPILLKIAGKLDFAPIIEKLKAADIFDAANNSEDALKQLSREKLGLLGMEVITLITPQLGKIADDIPALVAAYKGVTLKEAEELDAAAVINELINDEGVRGFFKTALRKKSGPAA